MRRGGWLAVAGARPNFVKIAPLVRAAKAIGRALPWVHTGQHYDEALSGSFLHDLRLPPPVAHLSTGAGSPSQQTARILERLEPVLLARRPSVLVVVGDVTSTLAAALCASHVGIPVAHVEAGLRSFDESMPEERNRILVDRLSRRLYVSEPSGIENLAREGVPAGRARLVGNVMIDALREIEPRLRSKSPAGIAFALVTLHRPSNVDDPKRLRAWCGALEDAARGVRVVFPVHPRTRARLRRAGLARGLARSGVEVVDPMPYVEFLAHVRAACVVLTDSGGIQEEASYLGVPCLTLRDSTERPLTVERGTNRLVGAEPSRLAAALRRVLAEATPKRIRLRLWDGRASERIVSDLASHFV